MVWSILRQQHPNKIKADGVTSPIHTNIVNGCWYHQLQVTCFNNKTNDLASGRSDNSKRTATTSRSGSTGTVLNLWFSNCIQPVQLSISCNSSNWCNRSGFTGQFANQHDRDNLYQRLASASQRQLQPTSFGGLTCNNFSCCFLFWLACREFILRAWWINCDQPGIRSLYGSGYVMMVGPEWMIDQYQVPEHQVCQISGSDRTISSSDQSGSTLVLGSITWHQHQVNPNGATL